MKSVFGKDYIQTLAGRLMAVAFDRALQRGFLVQIKDFPGTPKHVRILMYRETASSEWMLMAHGGDVYFAKGFDQELVDFVSNDPNFKVDYNAIPK